jgi:hypothetical protein
VGARVGEHLVGVGHRLILGARASRAAHAVAGAPACGHPADRDGALKSG